MKRAELHIEFLSTIRDTVYRLALSLVGDCAEAEDITQDICERVWRARDAILDSRYPRAYVCRMTHNMAIDRLRAKLRLVELGDEGFRRIDSCDGEQVVELGDVAELTRRAIASLPDKQQMTIYMRDVEGYDIEEIAEAMECDEASVRMNLSRARKAVREELLKIMNYGVR